MNVKLEICDEDLTYDQWLKLSTQLSKLDDHVQSFQERNRLSDLRLEILKEVDKILEESMEILGTKLSEEPADQETYKKRQRLGLLQVEIQVARGHPSIVH